MSQPPSSQTTPQFYRVCEQDLTEIELHPVDSINDLHRTHPEHYPRGVKPPRPAYTPSLNGNLYTHDGTAVNHRVQQEDAIRMLTEAVGENEAAAAELSQLIQELQALRLNLTARRGGT